MKNSEPRKKYVAVWCTLEERQIINARAKLFGVSASEFLRGFGMNCRLPAVRPDMDAVREIVRVNADLARLSNLLKMRIDQCQELGASAADVCKLYQDINQARSVLLDLIASAM